LPEGGKEFMTLLQKHSLRVNRLILIVFTISSIFMTVGLCFETINKGSSFSSLRTIIPFIALIAGTIGTFLLHGKYSNNILFARISGITFVTVYSVVLFCASGNDVYPYMFPMIVALILTLDSNVYKEGLLYVIVNLIKAAITYFGSADRASAM
jgi:hypothetical protein